MGVGSKGTFPGSASSGHVVLGHGVEEGGDILRHSGLRTPHTSSLGAALTQRWVQLPVHLKEVVQELARAPGFRGRAQRSPPLQTCPPVPAY